MVGCELGGAYKNVIALAVGMAVGTGFGDNTTASLITRGLAETARLAVGLGADPLTLMGLAGLGDLVATCSSPLSRNRTFGEKLGQGMTTEEVTASTRQVAEGVKSCGSILALAQRNEIYAPMVQGVHAVIVGDVDRRGDDRQLPLPRDQARARLSHLGDRAASAAIDVEIRSAAEVGDLVGPELAGDCRPGAAAGAPAGAPPRPAPRGPAGTPPSSSRPGRTPRRASG